MNPRELGWLEGIIDGEGCLSLYKTSKGHWVPYLSITNTDQRILQKAKMILRGAGVVSGTSATHHADKTWKPMFQMKVCSNGLRVLLPKLKLVAKERQRLLLIRALGVLRYWGTGSHDAEYIELEKIYLSIRALNRKGVR